MKETQALKGRHRRRARRCLNRRSRISSISSMADVSPFQGSTYRGESTPPRALPWADLLRPFQGQVANRATPKLAPTGDAYPTCPVRFQRRGPAALVSCLPSVFSLCTTASELRPALSAISWLSVCADLTRLPSPVGYKPLAMSNLSSFAA